MHKSGAVAVIGASNVGKSTLVNHLVGGKVSIVAPKIQTTRRRILGIAMQGETQFVLIDTPGIFKAKGSHLEKSMVRSAFQAVKEADVVLYIVDASRSDKAFEEDFKTLNSLWGDIPVIIALNKIDLLSKEKLLKVAEKFTSVKNLQSVLMISALKGDGTADIFRSLEPFMTSPEWLFDPEDLTNLPQKLWAAEITREQLIIQLHQELPYETYVLTEKWEEFDNGSVKIHQLVCVARDSQKGIILGKGGKQIKNISEKSRLELESLLGRRVHLKVFVKVNENWMNKLGDLVIEGHLDE